MNGRPINLYVWCDRKLNQNSPVVRLKSMSDHSNTYEPDNNAIQLAKLLSYSLPSNTLDLFYEAIAKEVRRSVTNNPELINERNHLENIISITINTLAETEGDN